MQFLPDLYRVTIDGSPLKTHFTRNGALHYAVDVAAEFMHQSTFPAIGVEARDMLDHESWKPILELKRPEMSFRDQLERSTEQLKAAVANAEEFEAPF